VQTDGRKKRLAYNTFSSLFYQITTIVCGFIMPRLVLTAFGSGVNGLVQSVTQFLGIISFLELGVGAVVQSSLYKPLAEHDENHISRIIKSAKKFFRTIAGVLVVYVIFLVIFYPYFVKKDFGYIYTATLIVAISISFFAQYYFGIVNRLLLVADQRGYVQYNVQTVSVILNTSLCFLLIKFGFGIHAIKLMTSLIYLLQPIIIHLYVKKHYNINDKITFTKEPIKQKWNGIAQHVAAVVLDGTDVIVLTVFSTLSNVSVYSVLFFGNKRNKNTITFHDKWHSSINWRTMGKERVKTTK
jgi:O-antigen/teichoic acid export membrane protein